MRTTQIWSVLPPPKRSNEKNSQPSSDLSRFLAKLFRPPKSSGSATVSYLVQFAAAQPIRLYIWAPSQILALSDLILLRYPRAPSPNDVALKSHSNSRSRDKGSLAHPDLVKSEIIKPHRSTPTHESERYTQ
ncbi:hypothetical protein F511_10147 [Dorcoceras hygrometricum]|uniref:Uncharacterized protein n=1 Tax=Dorcoceras hygrometricum TaxID=472368 RepID=A0A2Z7BJU8_9LAMI|nr:hypothetical protein F511_10147 [Dorcoceras hygrometricum]